MKFDLRLFSVDCLGSELLPVYVSVGQTAHNPAKMYPRVKFDINVCIVYGSLTGVLRRHCLSYGLSDPGRCNADKNLQKSYYMPITYTRQWLELVVCLGIPETRPSPYPLIIIFYNYCDVRLLHFFNNASTTKFIYIFLKIDLRKKSTIIAIFHDRRDTCRRDSSSE